MVGGALARDLAFRVGLGVGGAAVASGSSARPSHSCGGWVCDLGVVVTSLIFGLVRGAGAFGKVLPTFVLVSRISSRNDTVAMPLPSARRLLRDLRQWSPAP